MNAKPRKKLEQLVPPGYPVKTELRLWCGGLLLALVWSFGYFGRLAKALDGLYTTLPGNKRVLVPGAVMPGFAGVLDGALVPFVLLAFCMLGFALSHYAYHWQGAKSVYLMRRLPDAALWHRLCLTLPLLTVLATLAAAAVLTAIYFALYLLRTPAQCLLPGGLMQQFWGGI